MTVLKKIYIRTCEHMILGQLRMEARQAKNAPLTWIRPTNQTKTGWSLGMSDLTWSAKLFFFLTFKKKYHILWQLFLIVPPKVQIVCVHLLIHRIREALLSSVGLWHSKEDDYTDICSRRNISYSNKPFHYSSSDCTCQPGSCVSFNLFSEQCLFSKQL